MKSHSYFHGLLITCLLGTAVYTPTAHANKTNDAIALIVVGACLAGGICLIEWCNHTQWEQYDNMRKQEAREQWAYDRALANYNHALAIYTSANQHIYTELDKQIEHAEKEPGQLIGTLKQFDKDKDTLLQTRDNLKKAKSDLQDIIHTPEFTPAKDAHLLLKKIPTLINDITMLLEQRNHACNFFSENEAYFTIEKTLQETIDVIKGLGVEIHEGHAIIPPFSVEHYYEKALYPHMQLYNDLKDKIQTLDTYKLIGKLAYYTTTDETTRITWEATEQQLRALYDAVSNSAAYMNEYYEHARFDALEKAQQDRLNKLAREQQFQLNALQATQQAAAYEFGRQLSVMKQQQAAAAQKQQWQEMQQSFANKNFAGQYNW